MSEPVGRRAGHPLVLAAGSMLDQSDSGLIKAAAAAGFDAVGLRLSTGRADREIEAARTAADRQGVAIHDVEVHRISSEGTDPGPLIEQTAALGASALLVVSDLPSRAETVTALRDVTERAAAVGIRVGLEYMAWTNPRSPLDAIAMADDVGCGLVVDVLHHHRVGAGPREFETIVRSGRLGWLQLCDAAINIADGPQSETPTNDTVGSGTLGSDTLTSEVLIHEARHGRLPPGQGELPLAEILALVPLETAVSVEVQSDELLALPPVDRARLLHDTARVVLDRPAQSPSSTG